MDYAVEIYKLSNKFYTDYPETQYPELMLKNNRPYTCLLIETKDEYFICVPFRSNITHKDAFLFKNTQRSSHTPSGLDYRKTVIIKNSEYIDSVTKAIVDDDEYKATIANIERIVNEVNEYVEKYIKHIQQTSILHPREFERHYQYSTLKYFHDILRLNIWNYTKLN